jgi:hypothetical protein
MDKDTFKGMCAVLSTLPSQQKWDDGVASVYLMIMRPWDDRVVGAIMRHVLLQCEFRPTVAEIRKIGLSLFGNVPTKAQAMYDIKSIITRWGSDRDKHAESIHPCLPMIVKNAGGWSVIGFSNSEENHVIVSEAYDKVMATYNMDSYLINPSEDAMKDLLNGGASTVKAITE